MDRHFEIEQTMAPATSTTGIWGRRAGISAALTICVLFWAGTAQAGHGFKSGFEHELGRITAQHVAAVTHLFFFGLHLQPHAIHHHSPGCGHGHYRAQPVHHRRHKVGHSYHQRARYGARYGVRHGGHHVDRHSRRHGSGQLGRPDRNHDQNGERNRAGRRDPRSRS